MPRKILILFIFISSTSLFAEVPELVQKSFIAMDNSDQDAWVYTCTTTEENEVRIEKHDPSNATPWTLVSVNAETPDANTAEEYAKSKNHEQDNDSEDTQKDKFADLADAGSWKLLTETDTELVYNFMPKSEDAKDAKIMKKLLGTMTFDKQNPHVKSFRLEAIKPFRPVIVAKILKMKIGIDFAEVGEGQFVRVRESEDVVVRALGKKQIQKSEKVCANFSRPVALPES